LHDPYRATHQLIDRVEESRDSDFGPGADVKDFSVMVGHRGDGEKTTASIFDECEITCCRCVAQRDVGGARRDLRRIVGITARDDCRGPNVLNGRAMRTGT
jgi:hypothetical protein